MGAQGKDELLMEELLQPAQVKKTLALDDFGSAAPGEPVFASFDCAKFHQDTFESEGVSLCLLSEKANFIVSMSIGTQAQIATKAFSELSTEQLKYPANLSDKYCEPIIGQQNMTDNDLKNIVNALLEIGQYS
jgi:hypothetical protein